MATRSLVFLFVTLFAGLVFSCAGPQSASSSTEVSLLFGTDRNRNYEQSDDPAKYFGNEKADEITFGTVVVTIPPNHARGVIERPVWWKLEFVRDEGKHFTLRIPQTMSQDAFSELVGEMVTAHGDETALVFLHGFNVSFENAAFTTAQFTWDLGYQGAPMFFSWPSNASIPDYLEDVRDVKRATSHIREFLRMVVSKPEVRSVFLVAHSLGSQAMTEAVKDILTSDPSLKGKIRELILAAPDIDARLFNEEIGPGLVKLGLKTTMYVSSKDLALKAAEVLFGGEPRIGNRINITPIPGIDTIDASASKVDFLGHGYLANHQEVLDDVAFLIHGFPPSDPRRLTKTNAGLGSFWKLH